MSELRKNFTSAIDGAGDSHCRATSAYRLNLLLGALWRCGGVETPPARGGAARRTLSNDRRGLRNFPLSVVSRDLRRAAWLVVHDARSRRPPRCRTCLALVWGRALTALQRHTRHHPAAKQVRHFNLHEYQSKDLLDRFGVNTQKCASLCVVCANGAQVAPR